MLMMILENVAPSLKGELSRWLMEVKAGVFLGRVSALVREQLWEKCNEKKGEGGIMMIYPWPTEQGFVIKTSGHLSRDIVDNDGLYFVRQPFKEVPF